LKSNQIVKLYDKSHLLPSWLIERIVKIEFKTLKRNKMLIRNYYLLLIQNALLETRTYSQKPFKVAKKIALQLKEVLLLRYL